ncbi:hypothetical protein [Nocardioides sp. YIM 152315]|uniref:hypothetical protein n=1 Tax=Nocardioides sp. YIM 152315 TaxID=3031760 RepID=UPI0023DC30DE|nr:hypothetical protein [Nocardioides sp. YIM 152315]MDF1604885.1 hypothetical protein [Nocardioides sp. YIM 152315]
MRPTAVISYLWDKHLGALDEFLAQFPVDTVIAPRAYCYERLEQIAAARGCAVVVLEELLPPGYARDREARKVLGALRAQIRGSDWSSSGVIGEGDVDTVRRIVRQRVGAEVPPAVELLDALNAAWTAHDIRLFVTTEDVIPLSKTAAAWARKRQVPSLHVAHSLALVDPYTVHAHLLTDVLAVYGPRGAEGYLDLGIDPARIVATGNPAWDDYASMRQDRDALRTQLLAKHGLEHDLPVVVFGTTWSAHLTALDTGDAHRRALAAFVAACADLDRRGVRFSAVVKDRPSNSDVGEEALASILAESGARARVVHTSEDGPQWAVAADVLVAVDSNYLVEAMLCGTPAVNLAGTAMLPMPPAFDGAAGVVEADPGTLAVRLRELIEDPDLRDRQLARFARRLEHYHVGGADGRAAHRVAAQMVRLAQTRPARRSLRQRLRQRLRHTRDVVVAKIGKER